MGVVRDSASDFFACFFNEPCLGCGSVCLGVGIGEDVDGCCVAFVEVSNSGGSGYCCSFWINFILGGLLYNYLNR